MSMFTPKDRRAHANAVGYHGAPVKADSAFDEPTQRAYNRGVADVLNNQTMGYLLGKNSPLSESEKATIKDENKRMREAPTPQARNAVKAERAARLDAKKNPAPKKGNKK